MILRINKGFALLVISLTITTRGYAAVSPEAQIYFDSSIAGLIETPKCLGCHVSGGSAGTTRLVFQSAGTNKNSYNALQFDSLITRFNSSYVLNKIKGINHGGGQQYSEISPGYLLFITFFDLLAEDYGDDDGDGVGNTADLCPNTPNNTSVDATGCEIDDDGDGVGNSGDLCPNTPNNASVDATGCTIQDDTGKAFFTSPGSSCRASDPAKSIKLQSRESGLTNTDDGSLEIICPITLENNVGNSNEWKLYLNATNSGNTDFSLSCVAYQYEGATKRFTEEKTIEVKATTEDTSAIARLAWETNPPTKATTYAIKCNLPSQGVIQSIMINLK